MIGVHDGVEARMSAAQDGDYHCVGLSANASLLVPHCGCLTWVSRGCLSVDALLWVHHLRTLMRHNKWGLVLLPGTQPPSKSGRRQMAA